MSKISILIYSGQRYDEKAKSLYYVDKKYIEVIQAMLHELQLTEEVNG